MIFFFLSLLFPEPVGIRRPRGQITSQEEATKIDKQRYLELRKGILKDYHIQNYLLSAVSSVGGIHKFFLAEYPYGDLPYAVWEGRRFHDFRLPKFFESLTDAQEEIDYRMDELRQKHLRRFVRNMDESDRLSIKTLPI